MVAAAGRTDLLNTGLSGAVGLTVVGLKSLGAVRREQLLMFLPQFVLLNLS
jgi:hypothetical protein